MKANVTKSNISDFDFLKLYLVISLKSGEVLVDKNFLEHRLYDYMDNEEYICLLLNIKIDRDKVNLDEAFITSYAYGLLLKTTDINKDKISISDIEAKEILKQFPLEYVEYMESLYSSLKDKEKFSYQLSLLKKKNKLSK